MEIRIIGWIVLLAVFKFNSRAQTLQTVIDVDSNNNRINYTVLRDKPEIKHGIYRVSSLQTTFVEGVYRYGMKDGEWIYRGIYNPELNSDKLIVLYDSGEVLKKWSYYGLEINKTTYKNGKPDSLIRVLQEISIVKVRIKDNYYEMVKVHSASGVILVKGFLKNNKPDGEWKFYWRHGTAVQNYSDGVLNGPSFSFWPNGQMQQACMYMSGLLTGSRFMFYDNGDTLFKGRYTKGKQDGSFELRYLKNKPFAKAEYHMDSLRFYECFTQSGKSITTFRAAQDHKATIYRMDIRFAMSPSRVIREHSHIRMQGGIMQTHPVAGIFRQEKETSGDYGKDSSVLRFEFWFLQPFEEETVADQVARYSGFNDSTLNRLVAPSVDTILGYRVVKTRLIYVFNIDQTGSIESIESANPENESILNTRILFLLRRTTDFWITGSMYGIPVGFQYTVPIEILNN